MGFFVAKPSKVLSQYVKHYWMLESRAESLQSTRIHRIVPNGLHELIFYLNDRPRSLDKNRNISDNIQITGQLKDYYDIQISGKLSLFSIYFYPHGLSVFLDLPIRELFNQSVPLRFLFKGPVDRLQEMLSDSNSFAGRKLIVERFLIKQLRTLKNQSHHDRIKHSVGLVDRTAGAISIDQLALEACLSRKQFERTFSDFVGTSPKHFLRIVRFQYTLHQRSQNPTATLTELAYKCGYYDQSHMIADFASLSGITPKQYFKECEPYSDYFTNPSN